MAMGVTWEIGEFLSDQILLTQAQHGLNDTMLDLIFDLIGGGVVSILGMIYLKYTPKERFIKEMGIDDRLNLIKR
jgi:hypothetical protein